MTHETSSQEHVDNWKTKSQKDHWKDAKKTENAEKMRDVLTDAIMAGGIDAPAPPPPVPKPPKVKKPLTKAKKAKRAAKARADRKIKARERKNEARNALQKTL